MFKYMCVFVYIANTNADHTFQSRSFIYMYVCISRSHLNLSSIDTSAQDLAEVRRLWQAAAKEGPPPMPKVSVCVCVCV
jgi:hypothetical protein